MSSRLVPVLNCPLRFVCHSIRVDSHTSESDNYAIYPPRPKIAPHAINQPLVPIYRLAPIFVVFFGYL